MGRLIAPSNLPVGFVCREILIPDDPNIIAVVNGALSFLWDAERWEQLDPLGPTAEEIAELMGTMYRDYLESECGAMVAVAAKYIRHPNTDIVSGADYILNCTEMVYDTHLAVETGGDWEFTVPTGLGGYYLIEAAAFFQSTLNWSGVTKVLNMYAVKNGVKVDKLSELVPADGPATIWGSTVIECEENANLKVIITQASGQNLRLLNTATGFSVGHISITRLAALNE